MPADTPVPVIVVPTKSGNNPVPDNVVPEILPVTVVTIPAGSNPVNPSITRSLSIVLLLIINMVA